MGLAIQKQTKGLMDDTLIALRNDLHNRTFTILSRLLADMDVPHGMAEIVHDYLEFGWMNFSHHSNALQQIKNMNLKWITLEYERRREQYDMNMFEKVCWEVLKLWFKLK